MSVVRSGALDRAEERRTTTPGIDCPECGAPLTACYEQGGFHVDCPTHRTIARLPLPSGVATGRPVEDLYHVASTCGDWYLAAVREGLCPSCWARTEATVPVEAPSDFTRACSYAHVGDQCLARFSCTAAG